MTADEIRELIDKTTTIYRPGPEVSARAVTPAVSSVDVWIGTPPETERPAADDPAYEVVDVHFFRCAVDKAAAELSRDEFYELTDGWPPDPTYQPESRLKSGPSYIELGAQIGTFMGQQDALRIMALGQVLGCWTVITPETLLPPRDDDPPEMQAKRDQLAGLGLVLISGYKKPEVTP